MLLTVIQEKILLAYQIGFDLVDNSTQQFLESVRTHLPQGEEKKPEEQSKDAMEVEKKDTHPGTY